MSKNKTKQGLYLLIMENEDNWGVDLSARAFSTERKATLALTTAYHTAYKNLTWPISNNFHTKQGHKEKYSYTIKEIQTDEILASGKIKFVPYEDQKETNSINIERLIALQQNHINATSDITKAIAWNNQPEKQKEFLTIYKKHLNGFLTATNALIGTPSQDASTAYLVITEPSAEKDGMVNLRLFHEITNAIAAIQKSFDKIITEKLRINPNLKSQTENEKVNFYANNRRSYCINIFDFYNAYGKILPVKIEPLE